MPEDNAEEKESADEKSFAKNGLQHRKGLERIKTER